MAPKKPRWLSRVATKRFYWRGRQWTTARIDDGPTADKVLGKAVLATVFGDDAFIAYRGNMIDDAAIQAILHEAAHELFPEWVREPSDSGISELGIFERDVKALLEANGVDLRPLLVPRGK